MYSEDPVHYLSAEWFHCSRGTRKENCIFGRLGIFFQNTLFHNFRHLYDTKKSTDRLSSFLKAVMVYNELCVDDFLYHSQDYRDLNIKTFAYGLYLPLLSSLSCFLFFKLKPTDLSLLLCLRFPKCSGCISLSFDCLSAVKWSDIYFLV